MSICQYFMMISGWIAFGILMMFPMNRYSTNKRVKVVFGCIFSAIVVTFFAMFVWPTPYFYEKAGRTAGDNHTEYIYQINRITHEKTIIVNTFFPLK